MVKLESQIGKNVISLYDGEKVGYVLNICTEESLRKFHGFVVCDEESDREFFLPREKVKVYGEAIFIDYTEDMEAWLYENSFNPIGKTIYDKEGTNLGKVQDVEVLGGKVQKIITQKCELKPSLVVANGNNCVVVSRAGKKNKKKFNWEKLQEDKIEHLPKIEIMDTPKQKNLQISTPTRLNVNSSMLLNRKATEDVFGFNFELIVHKDEIISQKIIEKAKKHNKLNYLMFNSK